MGLHIVSLPTAACAAHHLSTVMKFHDTKAWEELLLLLLSKFVLPKDPAVQGGTTRNPWSPRLGHPSLWGHFKLLGATLGLAEFPVSHAAEETRPSPHPHERGVQWCPGTSAWAGWCQLSTHALTMPVERLSLSSAWASETPSFILRQPSRPRVTRLRRCVRTFGALEVVTQTQMSRPLLHGSRSPQLTRTRLGTREAKFTTRSSFPACFMPTRWTH